MADPELAAERLDPHLTVHPGDIIDLFAQDEGIVVLVRAGGTHRVVRLSLLGAEVLDAVGPGTTLGTLQRELRQRLGEPQGGGDLAELMAAALRSLADQGVVSLQQGGEDDAQS